MIAYVLIILNIEIFLNYLRGNILTQTVTSTFGELLKLWRKKAGLSQLDLALDADVSQRHLSFLESGRSQPTQSMVIRLAMILELPLRTQNIMLSAAGFSPVYTEHNLDAPEMAPIRQALSFILKQQEPYPAFVLNRYWQLMESNSAAAKMMAWFVDSPAQLLPLMVDGQLNMMKMVLHPEGLRENIENYDMVAEVLLQRLHREAKLEGEGSFSMELYQELASFNKDIQPVDLLSSAGHTPVLSTVFIKDGQRLNLFSTITTLGTPSDITLQELRIESLFPADESTDQLLKDIMAQIEC